MPNGKSRAKGLRGEQQIAKRLGGKRVGFAYLKSPVDVDLGWSVIQIKNQSLGGSAILEALQRLKAVAPLKNCYLMFKPKRGRWLVVETLEQFEGDHGKIKEVSNEPST